MLPGLLKRFNNAAKKTDVSQSEQLSGSIWQDTGEVYYLENTLKLTYTANSGVVTLEKLSPDSLANVVETLDRLPPDSPFARAITAAQNTALVISVCGVTWQKNNGTVRIKALPEAALLRSTNADFRKSQAVFKHAFLLEHDDLLTPTTGSGKPGVFTYNRISPAQFTRQLARANERIAPPLRRAIPVHPDNFNSAFTEHEQTVIDGFLDAGSQPENDALKAKGHES